MRDCLRAPDQRIGQHASEACCLVNVQFCCTPVKEFLSRRFYTKDTFTHLSNIQVYLHNSLLAPKEFDQDCIISLKSFPPPTMAAEGKAILCHLLINGNTDISSSIVICPQHDILRHSLQPVRNLMVFVNRHSEASQSQRTCRRVNQNST